MCRLQYELRYHQAEGHGRYGGGSRQARDSPKGRGVFFVAGDLWNCCEHWPTKDLRCLPLVPYRFIGNFDEESHSDSAQQSEEQSADHHDPAFWSRGPVGWNGGIQYLQALSGLMRF